MLAKLALGNVRRSARDFAIYFVTLALGVAVFYAFNSIGMQAGFLDDYASQLVQLIARIVSGITVFLAVVLGFLMVYANSYLIRRRKREMGLYQVLGMTRGQVSLVLTIETLLASAGSLVVGFALGILLSQLLVFVTAALFDEAVRNFTFRVSGEAALLTLECFAVMFVVMLLVNLVSLRRVSLSDLMGAERANERIKVRGLPATVVLGVAGVALVGLAYWRLTRDGLPVASTDQYQGFLVTTAIVVVGTVALFYALGRVILALGRGARGAYYRGINMFTVRQLASRVNTVSLSSAVISLILFLAIAVSASGFAMCAAFRTNLDVSAPYDASLSAYYPDDADPSAGERDLLALVEERGVDMGSVTRSSFQVTSYQPSSIEGGDALSFSSLSQASGVALPGYLQTLAEQGNEQPAEVIGQSGYDALRRANGLPEVDLGDDGYLFLCTSSKDTATFLQGVADAGVPIELAGMTLHPVDVPVDTGASATLQDGTAGSGAVGVIVVPDAVLAGALPKITYLNLMYSVPTEQGDAVASDAGDLAWGDANVDANPSDPVLYYEASRTECRYASVGISGTVAYLAIYIGFVLVVASAAILAIQQLTSASDAVPSYRLLSEIGVPRPMALRSLRTQIAACFAAPLVVALAHSAVALAQVIKVVRAVGQEGVGAYVGASVAVFVAVYVAYFAVTYAMARGLVCARTDDARA